MDLLLREEACRAKQVRRESAPEALPLGCGSPQQGRGTRGLAVDGWAARQMAEEIEWLDEELCNLTKELTDQLAALTSREGKKLSKADRDDKVRQVSMCVPDARAI